MFKFGSGGCAVRRPLTGEEPLDDIGDRVPDSVSRMVAARPGESHVRPGAEPTVVDEQAEPATPVRPVRRRLLLAGGALLIAGGGTGATVAAWGNDHEKPPGSTTRPMYLLGVHASTGTADAAVSWACERAARLAVAQHNAAKGRAYDLEVKVLADRGDASTAREVARRFTADRNVVAVLGPVAEIPMRTAAAVYGGAGLTHMSSTTGRQDYFLSSPNSSFQSGAADSALGGCIALHALVTGQVVRVGVVIDRSGGTGIQDQGALLVQQWRDNLGGEVVARTVDEDADGGPKAVRELLDERVQAVAYLGSLDATVRAARQLAAADFTGPRWMQHQLYGSDFPSRAGDAGEGWYVVTSEVDPAALTTRRAKDFIAAWRGRYGGAPEPYATEAYDSVRLLLAEFARTVPAGGRRRPARADLAERLAKAKYEGIARTYTFGRYHQYNNSERGWVDDTFVHQVHDGRFRQLGSLSDLECATTAPRRPRRRAEAADMERPASLARTVIDGRDSPGGSAPAGSAQSTWRARRTSPGAREGDPRVVRR
ncbi:ABC transporter substrate-binding protein [Streptomyces caeruleatus]|uniref:ABC transporter substrate-binding protein n=1 Tax=Streptomyces caeruleatus TaxID=661399 RepID=UPI00099E9777|nr:ABC transporter substrate-binding protein [Streptomyces caeruleatus]